MYDPASPTSLTNFAKLSPWLQMAWYPRYDSKSQHAVEWWPVFLIQRAGQSLINKMFESVVRLQAALTPGTVIAACSAID
jgi:hypothetical protein